MNMSLYGFGPAEARQWIMIDCGVSFGGDGDTPGIDVVMPDPTFIVENRRNLLGMILTHAHEDHIGAVGHLWRQLKCPVYATPFTASMLRPKLEEAGLLDELKLNIVPLGGKLQLGPFALELITLTHSIPEPNAIAIRTPLGNILHTGDWKIDPEPLVGEATDEQALRNLGEEGVLAMVCDSTNALVDGASGSEATVRDALIELIGTLKDRIAVTSFASNVARVESIVLAARAQGREVALVGRAMHRIVDAARENGFLTDLPSFVSADHAGYLPRDKVLYLCTGSQGEPAAALTRIANGDHPDVTLQAGDAVIYSSRIIPGNEKGIFAVHNKLAERGIHVLTEKDHFVHVSGHPCRDELTQMYQWVRPRIAVPVHGEMRHLLEHAQLARDIQVPEAVVITNGKMLRLAPGAAEVIDEAPFGRLYRDGNLLVRSGEGAVQARRGLSFAGFVGVTVVLDRKGHFVADPVLHCEGVPVSIIGALQEAAEDAASRLTHKQLVDDAETAEAIRRAVRKEASHSWGKRPITKVEVVRLR